MIRFLISSILFVSLVSITFISCNAQHKTSSATFSENNLPAEDPYFVKTKDTISLYGPRSITRNILQDKNGNFWFATWQGIIRYDGKFFTNFTLKEGLRHFHIFSVSEDKTGNIWFGTIGGGMYRYDGKSFTYFTTKDGLASNVVWCILPDKSGNIWFGTDNGVSRYDGKSFINFTTKDGLLHNSILSMMQDKTGKIWFGTQGGISCYETTTDMSNGDSTKRQAGFTNFTNETSLHFIGVCSILADKTGHIWIGSQAGLSRYDPSASLNTGRKSFTTVTTNSSHVFEDRSGKFWMNASSTNPQNMVLYRYDPLTEPGTKENSFTEIIVKNDQKDPFTNQIFGVTEDRNGNIWFGTVNGVCYYDGKSFTNFSEH
ncbi:MAG: histidine kinase [Bacteroidia bacterium]|nr:histidine kinase [Bacteroidia bacterium]